MKLQAEFDAPIWHVMALMVEFDLTETWNAFMQVSSSGALLMTDLDSKKRCISMYNQIRSHKYLTTR